MNINNYKSARGIIGDGSLMCLDDTITSSLFDSLNKIKYFHDHDFEHDVFVSTRCNIKIAKENTLMFTLNNENKITYNYPAITNTLDVFIVECPLCDGLYEYTIKPGDSFELEYCPYYTNAAKKIQIKWRLLKKLPTLWKIAEYYTAKKYSPENVFNTLDSLKLKEF